MNQTMKVISFADYANGVDPGDPLKFTNLNIGAGTKNGPSNRFNGVKFALQATLEEFRTGRTTLVQNMNKLKINSRKSACFQTMKATRR